LKFQVVGGLRSKGTLRVSFKEVRNTAIVGRGEGTISCNLLPTAVKRSKPANFRGVPICKEEFVFQNIKHSELASERVLEIALMDANKNVIGGFRLGPTPQSGNKAKEWMDSTREEERSWESVLANPGEWIEFWHPMRTSMDYQRS